MLAKEVKTRRESVDAYEKAGREDLAEQGARGGRRSWRTSCPSSSARTSCVRWCVPRSPRLAPPRRATWAGSWAVLGPRTRGRADGAVVSGMVAQELARADLAAHTALGAGSRRPMLARRSSPHSSRSPGGTPCGWSWPRRCSSRAWPRSSRSRSSPPGSAEVGDIADRDVRAPRSLDYISQSETDQRRQAARDAGPAPVRLHRAEGPGRGRSARAPLSTSPWRRSTRRSRRCSRDDARRLALAEALPGLTPAALATLQGLTPSSGRRCARRWRECWRPPSARRCATRCSTRPARAAPGRQSRSALPDRPAGAGRRDPARRCWSPTRPTTRASPSRPRTPPRPTSSPCATASGRARSWSRRASASTTSLYERLQLLDLLDPHPDLAKLAGWFLLSTLIVGSLLGLGLALPAGALASQQRAAAASPWCCSDDAAAARDGRPLRAALLHAHGGRGPALAVLLDFERGSGDDGAAGCAGRRRSQAWWSWARTSSLAASWDSSSCAAASGWASSSRRAWPWPWSTWPSSPRSRCWATGI